MLNVKLGKGQNRSLAVTWCNTCYTGPMKTSRRWSAQITGETFPLFSTFKKLLNSRQELSTYTVEMRCSIRYSAAKPSPRRACVRNPSSSALIGDNSDMKLETTGEGRETWFRITHSNKTSERNSRLKKETGTKALQVDRWRGQTCQH